METEVKNILDEVLTEPKSNIDGSLGQKEEIQRSQSDKSGKELPFQNPEKSLVQGKDLDPNPTTGERKQFEFKFIHGLEKMEIEGNIQLVQNPVEQTESEITTKIDGQSKEFDEIKVGCNTNIKKNEMGQPIIEEKSMEHNFDDIPVGGNPQIRKNEMGQIIESVEQTISDKKQVMMQEGFDEVKVGCNTNIKKNEMGQPIIEEKVEEHNSNIKSKEIEKETIIKDDKSQITLENQIKEMSISKTVTNSKEQEINAFEQISEMPVGKSRVMKDPMGQPIKNNAFEHISEMPVGKSKVMKDPMGQPIENNAFEQISEMPVGKSSVPKDPMGQPIKDNAFSKISEQPVGQSNILKDPMGQPIKDNALNQISEQPVGKSNILKDPMGQPIQNKYLNEISEQVVGKSNIPKDAMGQPLKPNAFNKIAEQPVGKSNIPKDAMGQPIVNPNGMNIEQMDPFGQMKNSFGKSMEIEEEKEEKIDFDSIPLLKKLVNKNWKIKQRGFQDLKKLFESAAEGSEPFQHHSEQYKLYLKERHPNVLEKVYSSFTTFMKRKGGISIPYMKFAKLIIQKGISSNKQIVSANALDALSEIFEASDKQSLYTLIINEIKQKNFKLSCVGLKTLLGLLENFGIKDLEYMNPFYLVLKAVATTATNPKLKKEIVHVYQEIFKWLGDACMPNIEELGDIKPFYKKQLDDFTQTYKRTKMRTKRSTAPIGMEIEEEEVNMYDIAKEKDIFKQFNEKWTTKVLGTEKWKIQVKMMQELIKAAKSPKLSNSNHSHIIIMVKRLLNHSNVSIQACAFQILIALAKGLRENFTQTAKQITKKVIYKIQDKNRRVENPAKETLEIFFKFCYSISDVSDLYLKSLKNKNPGQVVRTMQVIERYFMFKLGDLNEMRLISEVILNQLKTLTNDADITVRMASLCMIGELKALFGRDFVNKVTKDMIDIRLNHVERACEQMEEVILKKPQECSVLADFLSKKEKKGRKRGNRFGKQRNSGENRRSSSLAQKKTKIVEEKKISPKKQDLETSEKDILEAGIPQEDLTNFKGENIKEKLLGMSKISEWVLQNARNLQNQSQFFQNLFFVMEANIKSGWKTANLRIQKQIFAFLIAITENEKITMRKGIFMKFYEFICNCMGDIKFYRDCNKLIMQLCMYIHPNFLFRKLISTITNPTFKGSKNVYNNMILIINEILEKIPMKELPMKDFILLAKFLIEKTDGNLRTKGISFTGILYQHIGPGILQQLGELKQQIKGQLEENFSHMKMVDKEEVKEFEFKGIETPIKESSQESTQVDVSSSLTNVLELMEDNKNLEKGAKEIRNILMKNQNIQKNGCDQLMIRMAIILKNNTRIAIIKGYVLATQELLESIGQITPDLKPYATKLLFQIIQLLSNSNMQVKPIVLSCLQVFISKIGIEAVFNESIQYLNKRDQKSQETLLNIFLSNQSELHQVDGRRCIKTMLLLLTGKFPVIKRLSKQLLRKLLTIIKKDKFMVQIMNLQQAKQRDLKKIFDSMDVNNSSEMEIERPRKQIRAQSSFGHRIKPKRLKKRQEPQPRVSIDHFENVSNTHIQIRQKREKRIQQNNRSQWPLHDLDDDLVNTLFINIKENFSKQLYKNLKSWDFRKNITAIKTLQEALILEGKEFQQVFDILIRWLFVKLFDNCNVEFGKNAFELLKKALVTLGEIQFQLDQKDAQIILATITGRFNFSSQKVSEKAFQSLWLLKRVFPRNNVFQLVITHFKIKNQRIKKQLAVYLGKESEQEISTKQITQLIKLYKVSSSQDQEILLVDVFSCLYEKYGEDLWKYFVIELQPKKVEMIRNKLKELQEKGHGSKAIVEEKVVKKVPELPVQKLNLNEQFQSLKELANKIHAPSETENIIQLSSRELMRRNLMLNKVSSLEQESQTSINLQLQFVASIKMLRSGNVGIKLDGLVGLHKLWLNQDSESHKELHKEKGEELMAILQETLEGIFDQQREKIPYKFTDFFIQALQKFSSTQQFFQVPLTTLHSYVKSIIFLLLEEDKNQEENDLKGGNYVKVLNGNMLRILENSKSNDMFLVLFSMLIEVDKMEEFPKAIGLITKCIVKLSRSIPETFESLNVPELMEKFNLYFTDVIKFDNDRLKKDIAAKSIRTIMNEFYKIQGEGIWESVRKIKILHPAMENIISNIFRNQAIQKQSSGGQNEARNIQQALQSINKNISNPESIRQLYDILQKKGHSKSFILKKELSKYPEQFKQFVSCQLQKYSQKDEVKENLASHSNTESIRTRMNKIRERHNKALKDDHQNNMSIENEENPVEVATLLQKLNSMKTMRK